MQLPPAMAQTGDSRPPYPPQEGPSQGSYYGQQQSPQQRPPTREDNGGHYSAPPSSTEPPRQGQYPPPPAQHDPRAPAPYPPPGQWPGQQHSAYPPPPPTHHYPDPQHGAYPYGPPRPDMSQPPQPMQPDAYRLPPPNPHYPPYPGYYQAPQPPAPAPRQRTAIACKYCRKRKIRCSGYENSSDGRCQNCVRFNQQCLFHPVSSQAAFVPASAVYGPNARGPMGAQDGRPGENGQYRNGEPMLYGAHGQPLGPVGPQPQSPYNYGPPPQGYPPQGYQYPPQYPPQHQGPPPAGQSGPHYEQQGQGPPSDDRVSLKRPLSDEDPHNENSHTSQSPHPNARARHSTYDSRANSRDSYGYPPDPANLTPTSPTTSIMSHQSYPPQPYTNGHAQKGNVSPPAGMTPNSAQSHHSPYNADGTTPPPNQANSASSSVNATTINGRSGMSVHDMLGGPSPHGSHSEQRAKNDNDMLSKLDGKK